MTPPEPWVVYCKVAEIEQAKRATYHRRLGFHTSVILVLYGAVGAALWRGPQDPAPETLWFAALVTAFVGVFATLTPSMLHRIYCRALEFTLARERLEQKMGLRKASEPHGEGPLAGCPGLTTTDCFGLPRGQWRWPRGANLLPLAPSSHGASKEPKSRFKPRIAAGVFVGLPLALIVVVSEWPVRRGWLMLSLAFLGVCLIALCEKTHRSAGAGGAGAGSGGNAGRWIDVLQAASIAALLSFFAWPDLLQDGGCWSSLLAMLPAGLVVGSLVAVVMLAEEDGRGRSKGDGTLMGLVAALAALVLLAGVTLGALALFGVDSELLPGVTVNVSRWITWSIVVVGILVFSVPGALDAVLKVLLELPENILDWLSPDLHKRHRYHDWMTSALRALGLGGFVASLFFVFMATAGSERASGQGAEESSVSAVVDASTVIGPFALGEPCFSDEVRLAQVDALLREARAQGASTVELRGGVDLVPVVGDGDGFRSNAGLSYARARCVAGWIAQRSLAHGLRIELRGGEGTGARSAPGQAGSRVVTARFLVGASRDPP